MKNFSVDSESIPSVDEISVLHTSAGLSKLIKKHRNLMKNNPQTRTFLTQIKDPPPRQQRGLKFELRLPYPFLFLFCHMDFVCFLFLYLFLFLFSFLRGWGVGCGGA